MTSGVIQGLSEDCSLGDSLSVDLQSCSEEVGGGSQGMYDFWLRVVSGERVPLVAENRSL